MNKYQDKHVLIVGLGVSGVAVAKYMGKQGARVTVSDLKQKSELIEHVNALADIKIEYDLGAHNPLLFRFAQ